MLNALVTLPFLLALATAALVAWEAIGANRAKIAAALKGRSLLVEPTLATRPVSIRYSARKAPVRAIVKPSAQWRVAA